MNLDELLAGKSYEYKWISGKDVIIAQWVRMKCMYGCDGYGKKATCPPNVPPLDDCREFFREYERIAVIHSAGITKDTDEANAWKAKVYDELLALEKQVFISGFYKTILLPMGSCHLCQDCQPTRVQCTHKMSSRPTPEALGVDVFTTVRSAGFPIDVLSAHDQMQNRYSFLMVE